jgi:hypothetical protein
LETLVKRLVAHFCVAFTIKASFLCALTVTVGCRELYSLWARQVHTCSIHPLVYVLSATSGQVSGRPVNVEEGVGDKKSTEFCPGAGRIEGDLAFSLMVLGVS